MTAINLKFVQIFFILMLIIPTTFQSERAILLILINVILLFGILINTNLFSLSKQIFIPCMICVLSSCISIFIGASNNTPGFFAVIPVFIIWPILYTWMMGFVSEFNFYIKIVKTLAVGILINSLMIFLFLSQSIFGSFPNLNSLFSFFDFRGGISDSGFEFNILGMGVFIYGLAYFGTRLYGFADINLKKDFNKPFYFLIFIFAFACMLLSGRRGFMLAIILAIPIAIFVLHISGIKRINFKNIINIFTIFILFIIFAIMPLSYFSEFDISQMYTYFISGFEFDNLYNSTASRRSEQFLALINGWMINPIFGAGLGAFAIESPGPDIQPWAYELQYVSLLFQTGLFGFSIYFFSVVWLIYNAIKFSKIDKKYASVAIPSTVALIAFLIANATNPYLGKFDFLWTLFFQASIVNYGFLKIYKHQLKIK